MEIMMTAILLVKELVSELNELTVELDKMPNPESEPDENIPFDPFLIPDDKKYDTKNKYMTEELDRIYDKYYNDILLDLDGYLHYNGTYCIKLKVDVKPDSDELDDYEKCSFTYEKEWHTDDK